MEEIPVYWTIDWENEATFENAKINCIPCYKG